MLKKVNVIGEINPVEPDSVRIGIEENLVQIEFGKTEHVDKKQNEVRIVSAVRLNPKYLQQFMVKILEAGITYEKTFNEDIGFSTFWQKE